MKIALWTTMAAMGLTLAACGGSDNGPPTSGNTSTGSSGGGTTNSGPSGPSSSDFLAFVNNQVMTQPAYGSSAPTATTTLTTDFALDTPGAFSYIFNAGDALPAGTYQASVACTQVGLKACNPMVSADLNSTLD
ncbi:MAG TPA: hypothetical protein VHW25_01255 [Steroidobacteraceae bacterium]|jgi:hypothetical protein|nr:hypothetical protein [Steroidobacteraceae bacterium]